MDIIVHRGFSSSLYAYIIINKSKKCFICFVLFSLIRTLDLRSKVLSFDNKNKKCFICFVLFSLIRTFAPELE